MDLGGRTGTGALDEEGRRERGASSPLSGRLHGDCVQEQHQQQAALQEGRAALSLRPTAAWSAQGITSMALLNTKTKAITPNGELSWMQRDTLPSL